ncbi:hypothetical protein CORC01_09727 [Colletotrichum orchidophilum]|uniref:Uncharacterized protein n=1 Tax=Colletotrichum orchidophilum TaxID=1209926 RepID=A0A1G4B0R7_9PEZI|nr:uncharacterized protein CORC01_09727 [Colletotrichum orchidophilum]OHE94933.1 hypothetical protein CORC01_09727 [Colletotrichum orchidophilum]
MEILRCVNKFQFRVEDPRYLFVYLHYNVRCVCVTAYVLYNTRPTYTTLPYGSVMRMGKDPPSPSPCILNVDAAGWALQETFQRPWSCHDGMAVSASRFRVDENRRPTWTSVAAVVRR